MRWKKKPVKFIGEIGNNSIDSLAIKAGLDSPACFIDQSQHVVSRGNHNSCYLTITLFLKPQPIKSDQAGIRGIFKNNSITIQSFTALLLNLLLDIRGGKWHMSSISLELIWALAIISEITYFKTSFDSRRRRRRTARNIVAWLFWIREQCPTLHGFRR